MKRIGRIVALVLAPTGITLLCLIIFILIAITWKIPLHNYQLRMMQKHFRSTMQSVHPMPSKLRAEMAEFGNFGNSNHCDYFVGEFRSSPLPKDKVLEQYAAVVTSSFIGNRLIETGVYFVDEDFFKKDYLLSEWLEKYLPNHPH
ncbi:MAG: hypothetical protein WAP52_00050, partial [Candidatus Sungiibacteriota bacterium]